LRTHYSCERVPSNISDAIGLLRRVTSNHNTAEAAAGQTEIGGLEAVTSGLEVVTGRLESVAGGLEAMVDMESLLLQCCHQEPPPEAATPKENLIATSIPLTI
jgi:hypothetical protein